MENGQKVKRIIPGMKSSQRLTKLSLQSLLRGLGTVSDIGLKWAQHLTGEECWKTRNMNFQWTCNGFTWVYHVYMALSCLSCLSQWEWLVSRLSTYEFSSSNHHQSRASGPAVVFEGRPWIHLSWFPSWLLWFQWEKDYHQQWLTTMVTNGQYMVNIWLIIIWLVV